jgi:hypothetical protein
MNAPDADAPQELQFRLQVDEAHCDRAAQGMRLMAQYQYRSLVRRYEGAGWLKRFQQRARKGARAFAVVVLAASLFGIWTGCVDPPHRGVWFGLAAILFLEALALWLLPSRAERIGIRARAWFERSFGDRAAARMRKTRQAAPFEAVYDLRGDLLTYSRVEKGQWTLRWHRQLGKFKPRGVALQVPGLLAIFSKPGMVVPAIIVLTATDGAMAAAIRALGWTIVDIDPTSGDPVASAAGAVDRS